MQNTQQQPTTNHEFTRVTATVEQTGPCYSPLYSCAVRVQGIACDGVAYAECAACGDRVCARHAWTLVGDTQDRAYCGGCARAFAGDDAWLGETFYEAIREREMRHIPRVFSAR